MEVNIWVDLGLQVESRTFAQPHFPEAARVAFQPLGIVLAGGFQRQDETVV